MIDRIECLFYRFIGRQYIPKKEELNNEKVKELAERLKGDSDFKTLNNILEWQTRNLKFWTERFTSSTIIMGIVILSSLLLAFYLYKTNHLLSVLVILLGISFIFTDRFNILNVGRSLIFLFLVLLCCIIQIIILFPKISLTPHLLFLFLGMSSLTGAFISILVNLRWNYKSIKNEIPEFNIEDTFRISLPIEKILKYRLSICRDYAKLTSALLLNIYPNKEIYFVLIPNHVAVAIKVDEKIFVLDQRLPIRDLEDWIKFWKKRLNKKELNEKYIRVYLEKDKVVTEKVKLKYCSKSTDETLNNFINKLKKEMNIKGLNKKLDSKETGNIEIPIKDFKSNISSDKVITNSLLRLAKLKINNEFISNYENIIDLNAFYKGDDLILSIRYKK